MPLRRAHPILNAECKVRSQIEIDMSLLNIDSVGLGLGLAGADTSGLF